MASADTQTPIQEMNCPHCNQEIPDKDIAKHFAAIGGKKSKRAITPEQQAMMQEARLTNKKKNDNTRKAE